MPVERPQTQMTGEGFRRESYLAAANISALLGEPASEQAKYLTKVAAIDANFTARFFHAAAGVYAQAGRNASQCGQSMPLFMGMVAPESKPAVVSSLLDTVKAAKGNMLVGMFGIKWFLMALADAGHVDEAFASVATSSYLSYGFMLDGNATTLSTDGVLPRTVVRATVSRGSVVYVKSRRACNIAAIHITMTRPPILGVLY